MKIYLYPTPSDLKNILKRPVFDTTKLHETVNKVLHDLQNEGDAAVQRYTKQFDGADLSNFLVDAKEFLAAKQLISKELQTAIRQAAKNITKFHNAQKQPVKVIETMPGVACWRKSVGIQKVGLYIPGGTAPLFSTILMLGIPAKIAGCAEVVLCTPPDKNGHIHPAILFAAELVGIQKVFKIGGMQAIGAMAFGTETVPKVFKIFGPGNQYVTAAKQIIQQHGVAIDMPAGPSEVMVIADETCVPDFVAADLLSQAEHGADSQVVLVTFSEHLAKKIIQCIDNQVITLPRNIFAEKSLANSKVIIVNNRAEAIAVADAYAAEHLIIATQDADDLATKITNAGSIFIGNYSPEAVGDYASGTNHTLPTNGFANAYSGVSLDSFVKKITYQKITETGIQNIGRTVELMAEAEQLEAHKRAVSVRLNFLDVQIIDYQPDMAIYFKKLNEEWITQFFKLEEPDRKVLDHPETYLLAKGGAIIFARHKGEIVGTCGLLKSGENEYELVKMGVTASAQGKKIGKILGVAILEKAKTMGATKVVLESNRILTSAMFLYKSLGFKEIPPIPSPYSRADIRMEKTW
jgi:histidinol dehydrogenase